MFQLAVLAFVVAAILGITLAVMHFTHKAVPVTLALVHGLFAASGLVALIAAGMKASFPSHTGLALGLFLVTALGGFVLFGMQLAKKALPSALVVIHACAAVVALLVLLSSAYPA